jgi:hypothetical protein
LVVAALAALVTAGASGVRAQSIESLATELYKSLTPEQRAKGVLKFDDPARKQEQYTGGARAGIQLKDLTEPQRGQAMAVLTAFASEYGKQKAEAIAAQEPGGLGLGQYYLAFFGRPGEDQEYAWRIAEHHLTLVDVRVVGGEAKEFGPILLGANPPVLWYDEEDRLIELYQAMTPEERKKASMKGRADASKPMGKGGVVVGELGEAARKKVEAVFEQRLAFFSPEIQDRVKRMVGQQGGIGAMRVAFWGVADKRCTDGGKWDFKLGGDSFLCDYENSRGHIHLSMKGSLATAAK